MRPSRAAVDEGEDDLLFPNVCTWDLNVPSVTSSPCSVAATLPQSAETTVFPMPSSVLFTCILMIGGSKPFRPDAR